MNSPRPLSERSKVHTILDGSRHPRHAVLYMHIDGIRHSLPLNELAFDQPKVITDGWSVMGRQGRIVIVGPDEISSRAAYIGKAEKLYTTKQALEKWRLTGVAVGAVILSGWIAGQCNPEPTSSPEHEVPASIQTD